jgi:hypothetical protein
MQLVQEFVNNGDRERVADGLSIEHPVVDAEPTGTIILLDQQHRGRECRRAAANYLVVQHVVALSFQLVLVYGGVAIGADGNGADAGQQVDVVVASRRGGGSLWGSVKRSSNSVSRASRRESDAVVKSNGGPPPQRPRYQTLWSRSQNCMVRWPKSHRIGPREASH